MSKTSVSAAHLRMFNSVSAQGSGNGNHRSATSHEESRQIAEPAVVETRKKKRKGEFSEEPIPEVDMSAVRLPQVEAFNPFRILPMKGQIRQQFFGVESLADSIKAVGQLVPVIVVRIKGNPRFDAQLVDGEGRLRACQNLKRGIAAYVWDGDTDIETLYEASVAANCNRHGHNPAERLAAVMRMKANGRSDKHIANVFGASVAWVGQHYMLRRLHSTVLQWLIPVLKDKGKDTGSVRSGSDKAKAPLSFHLGLLLSQIEPAEAQIQYAREIIAKKMSLAQARHYIAGVMRGVSGLHRSNRHAGDRIATLASQARSVDYKFLTYAEMSDAEIQSLLGKMSEGNIQSLDTSLARLSGTITTLREAIKRSLPKGMKLKLFNG